MAYHFYMYLYGTQHKKGTQHKTVHDIGKDYFKLTTTTVQQKCHKSSHQS